MQMLHDGHFLIFQRLKDFFFKPRAPFALVGHVVSLGSTAIRGGVDNKPPHNGVISF
jgi:hypothetical protein